MKLPLGGCFPWESFLYSEERASTLRRQWKACRFSTQGSFGWHSWAKCSSSGAASWAFSCSRSQGRVHSMRTRQRGDTSQLRASPKQANPAGVKVSSRCAHPPRRAAESHPLGHSLPSESHVSVMKQEEGKNTGFCFPPCLFLFLNDYHKSELKSLGAAALSEIFFTSLKKFILLKWEWQNGD